MPDWLRKALNSIEPPVRIWLVGGAVRDGFLGRATSDFDFVVEGDSLQVARLIADRFQSDFYVLDPDRSIGRTIIRQDQKPPLHLDFSPLMGSTIEDDLSQRDFSMNALGIRVNQEDPLLDPCGGLQDLKDNVLRQCSKSSIRNDPIRMYRAIRFAVSFKAQIEKRTLIAIREIGSQRIEISVERMRDELFRILALRNPGAAFRLIDQLNLFPHLEETFQFGKLNDSMFETRVSLLERMASLVQISAGGYDRESALGLAFGEVRLQLAKFEKNVQTYLTTELSQGRARRELMLLAVLTGPEGPTKPSDFEWPPVRAIQSQSNRIREIAQKMRLSSKEANWLGRFIAGTLLPYLDHPVGRREIFRILKTAKDASPALVFFSMARSLTAQSPLTDGDGWHTQVQNARKTFETYWEEGDQVVAGSSLISGTDLMESLGIEPGPKLGRMLLALGEARFVGEIRTREDAIEMARKMMNDETVKRG